MSNLADSAAPTNNLIRSRQVSPLPIGSGGSNPVKQQLNDTNVQLAMLTAQATVNTKYDPPVPLPITKAVTKEAFTTNILSSAIFVIGGLLIVYGIVVK